jgi:TonB family protein
MLKDAGIGGTVILWVYIDESGTVQKSQVNKTSGYPAMDKAAQDVAGDMQFSPAYNRDKKTPVWIAIPIEFKPSS